MNILIAMHPMMDMGGIIGDTEAMIRGYRKLGHKVQLLRLVHRPKIIARPRPKKEDFPSVTGMSIDPIDGWRWDEKHQFPYKGKENMRAWRKLARTFDLIIWQIPVPSTGKSSYGNTEWPELYNVPTPQVIYIHDHNFRELGAHIYAVKDHVLGIACSHLAGYYSLESIDLPRMLVYPPMENIEDRWEQGHKVHWLIRKKQAVACHTYKVWKRLPELIRAFNASSGYELIVAGDGIDRRYLASKDKPKYGNIWYDALDSGMKYVGRISPEERDQYFLQSRCSIDASWTNAADGSIFNKAFIESMIMGAVPISRDRGVIRQGKDEDFIIPGEHFICVPWNASPEEFGSTIKAACNMGAETYDLMSRSCYDLVRRFDNIQACKDLIALSKGRPGGMHGKLRTGKFDRTVKEKSDKILATKFGIKPERKS